MNPQTIFSNVASNLLTDGLSALNAIGPAILGVALMVDLFLRILRMISRRFGKDFTIYYTPPERKKSNFSWVFKDISKDCGKKVNGPPPIADVWHGKGHDRAWGEIGDFITAGRTYQDAYPQSATASTSASSGEDADDSEQKKLENDEDC